MSDNETMSTQVITFPGIASKQLNKTLEEMRDLTKAVKNIYKVETMRIEKLAYEIEKFCEHSVLAYEAEEDIDMLIWDIRDQGKDFYDKEKISDGWRGLVSSLLEHPVYSRHLEDYINLDFDKNPTGLIIQTLQIMWMDPSDDPDELYKEYMEVREESKKKCLKGKKKE